MEGYFMAYVPYDETTKVEMFENLLSQIEAGKSMREVCRMDGMPDHTTVIRWLKNDASLATRYAHARVAQADVLFDRMEAVEEAVSAGTMDSHAARVVLDSMRWRASKLAPKVYGDRLDVQVSDNRISIKGALEAANARLAHVIDVTPSASSALVHEVHEVHDVQSVQDDQDD
jgi:hypothetical protein